MLTSCDNAGSRCVKYSAGGLDLRRQRRDVGNVGCSRRANERLGGRCNLQAPHRNPGNDQFMDGLRGRWQWRGVERCECTLRFVEMADQEKTPDREVSRVRSIRTVTVRLESGSRCVEGLRRPAQVARNESDLRLDDDTASAGQCFPRPEGTGRTSHEGPCSNQVAKLRHCDAAKCKRRRIVAQGDPIQCADRIACCQRARRRRD